MAGALNNSERIPTFLPNHLVMNKLLCDLSRLEAKHDLRASWGVSEMNFHLLSIKN